MKKSFMTRVLAVSLSAAMAFSMSSASNLMTASAASTVNLKTTFKTLKVNQKYKMTLKNNTLNWKITKVQTSNKKICTVYGKTSSYVMLKGKGVGRAKITVTVKTTKRKKNNVKKMKCTANVKAAAPEETFSASAVANSNTEVKVNFTQAVDAAAAENFTVSDGVTVSEAKLSDDKKSVVLTVAGAEYGKNYDLTVTGIKVAGKAQADQKLTFTTPAATEKYPMTLEAKDPILKSDGQSQTVVTFTIKDENGNLIKDKGVEVAFATSLGKFAEQRVSIQDGVATNMFTSEALMQTQTAQITATVVESTENKELLGLNTTASITLTPNPEDMGTAVGAIITSATAPTADRVIAYFNQKVNAEDFMTKSKKLDNSKFSCEVVSGLDNNASESDNAKKTKVVGILPVEGEENALQLLVEEPMVDNSNIKIRFKNNLNSNSLIAAENTVYCKLTDARQPSVLNVTSNGLREIKVEFSEAMLLKQHCDGWGTGAFVEDTAQSYFAADNVKNYLLDGVPLSEKDVVSISVDGESADDTDSSLKKLSWKDDEPEERGKGNGTLQVGKYASAKDERHIVTIKLAVGNSLAPGVHRLSVSNVGDWAAKTDRERNIVNTQGFDFTVENNDVLPTFTVEPQSPEQYKVTFNADIDLAVDGDTLKTKKTILRESVLKLQQRDGGSWVTISDGDGSGKNPIRVSKIKDEANAYIVEVLKDWTEVYKTSSTRRNYYNYDLRLHIDAGKIVNVANNKLNSEINVNLDQNIMKGIDVESPVIGEVVQAEDKSGNLLDSYNVTMSEPVKLSAQANGEGLTPSETQSARATATDANLGVPAPSAQFISADGSKTVDGIISQDAFLDATDTTINIEPSTTLDAGEWRLALSSISDDYGNTASTVVHTINVTRETATTDFRIVWAAVSDKREYDPSAMGTNGHETGRYIFVKFNKPVTLTGNSTNAQVTGNYTINGSTLPTGTQIYAKIKGYDSHTTGVVDSITIELPQGNFSNSYTYDVSALNAMLNVSRAITSTTGETLSNGGMIRLPFQFGSAADIKSLTYKTDAVWGNHDDEGILEKDNAEYFKSLKAALEDDKYRKVILNRNLDLSSKEAIKVFGKNQTLTIKRAVDFVVNGDITNGNVVVATSDIVDTMVISSDNNNTIGGNPNNKAGTATLKVDAGNIGHFTISGVQVNANGEGNAVNINDTYVNSFENAGVITGDVSVTDSNGAGIENSGIFSGKLLLNTKGKVNLKGNLSSISDGICVEDTAIVNIVAGADAKTMKMSVTASNARIIIDKEAQTSKDTTVLADAKDVRITIPRNQKVKLLVGANKDASFKAVTKDNKDVTTSSDDAITITDAGEAKKSDVAEKVAKLNVYTGVVGEAEVGNLTVSRGAISGGALDVNSLANKIGTETYTDSFDGASYKLEVTYSLLTSYGLSQNSGLIKVTNADAASDDVVRVIIKVVKGGKVVSETEKRITFNNQK